jgi:hypothetical protein
MHLGLNGVKEPPGLVSTSVGLLDRSVLVQDVHITAGDPELCSPHHNVIFPVTHMDFSASPPVNFCHSVQIEFIIETRRIADRLRHDFQLYLHISYPYQAEIKTL